MASFFYMHIFYSQIKKLLPRIITRILTDNVCAGGNTYMVTVGSNLSFLQEDTERKKN